MKIQFTLAPPLLRRAADRSPFASWRSSGTRWPRTASPPRAPRTALWFVKPPSCRKTARRTAAVRRRRARRAFGKTPGLGRVFRTPERNTACSLRVRCINYEPSRLARTCLFDTSIRLRASGTTLSVSLRCHTPEPHTASPPRASCKTRSRRPTSRTPLPRTACLLHAANTSSRCARCVGS